MITIGCCFERRGDGLGKNNRTRRCYRRLESRCQNKKEKRTIDCSSFPAHWGGVFFPRHTPHTHTSKAPNDDREPCAETPPTPDDHDDSGLRTSNHNHRGKESKRGLGEERKGGNPYSPIRGPLGGPFLARLETRAREGVGVSVGGSISGVGWSSEGGGGGTSSEKERRVVATKKEFDHHAPAQPFFFFPVASFPFLGVAPAAGSPIGAWKEVAGGERGEGRQKGSPGGYAGLAFEHREREGERGSGVSAAKRAPRKVPPRFVVVVCILSAGGTRNLRTTGRDLPFETPRTPGGGLLGSPCKHDDGRTIRTTRVNRAARPTF